MIEIIFPVYQRPHRVSTLLEQLSKQTNQDFRVNIWNNSRKQLDVSMFPQDRMLVVNAEKNNSGGDRYKLVPKTVGNPLIFLDDDESVDNDFVDYYYNEYKKWGNKCMLGWYSKLFYKDIHRNFNGDKITEKACRLPYGKEVDYLGAGGLVVDRDLFKDKSLVSNKRYYDKLQSDDIYLSYKARKLGYKLISIKPKCRIIDDGMDIHHTTRPQRKIAIIELRAKGWKFLEDGYKLQKK